MLALIDSINARGRCASSATLCQCMFSQQVAPMSILHSSPKYMYPCRFTRFYSCYYVLLWRKIRCQFVVVVMIDTVLQEVLAVTSFNLGEVFV